MRDGKEKRAKQGRLVDDAANGIGVSRSSTHPRKRAAESSDEDDLTRLVRIIARQAAQEAFAVFKDALDARAVSDPPLPGPSNLEHSPGGHAGNECAPHESVERFLSVAEVAKRLDVSEKTVRRKIAVGDWPAHRVGKLVRVSERVLITHLIRARAKEE
jgi:excisionase family DNA binding protein